MNTVSLPCDLFIDYDDALGVDADQTPADVGVFVVPYRCTVVHAALLITETSAGETTTGVVKFDKRPTGGSDTSRGDGDIATLVMGTTAAGKYLYDEVAKGTTLYPGQEVVVQLTTAATGSDPAPAGHFRPLLIVKPDEDLIGNETAGTLTA